MEVLITRSALGVNVVSVVVLLASALIHTLDQLASVTEAILLVREMPMETIAVVSKMFGSIMVYYRTFSKNSALLIIRHPLSND